MKTYKKPYGTSLPCFTLKMAIISIPAALIIDICFAFYDNMSFGTISLFCVLGFLGFALFGVVFSFLITLIINLFAYPSVFVNEKTITYENKTLDLDSIKYLTLYLPEIRSRISSTTQELSIYTTDKEHIVIKRPSIALIAYLKKRCTNAKFEIDEIKSRLKTDLIISAGIATSLPIIFYIANKQ